MNAQQTAVTMILVVTCFATLVALCLRDPAGLMAARVTQQAAEDAAHLTRIAVLIDHYTARQES